MRALVHGDDRGLNQLRCLFGGLRRFCSKVAHLVRHNCEAFAGIACACCFDRGIERKYIGLESDVLNDLGNIGNLIGGTPDIRHRFGKLSHMIGAVLHICMHLLNMLSRRFDIFGILQGLIGDFGNRSAQFFHGGSLFGRACREGLRPAGYLCGADADLFGSGVDGRQGMIQ
ncbi:hypothetical protein SDC9_172067 [bioreactor metagenome]|uniref:Uncharacterized protein n=1 Tax=bioreactor metagenome TaxID=1076179 RepID=A0A645GDA9_9ZZZZ